MSKFTDAVATTLRGYFNAGDQPTEAQFTELITKIQEGIEEHQHDATGDGDGIAALGPLSSLEMADDAWIGIGAALERIVFDAAGDITVMGAKFGVNVAAPQTMIHAISDAVFSTASYVAGGHTAFLVNTTEAAGVDVVGASLAFTGPDRVDRGFAAIAAIQGTADIDQVGLVFYTHPTIAYGDAIVKKMRLTYEGILELEDAMKIKERASAAADTAAYGQLWVKNTTPCQLWFTDDAGTDTQIV